MQFRRQKPLNQPSLNLPFERTPPESSLLPAGKCISDALADVDELLLGSDDTTCVPSLDSPSDRNLQIITTTRTIHCSSLDAAAKPTADSLGEAGTDTAVDILAIQNDVVGVANLGCGVLWQYCPWVTKGSSPAIRAQRELEHLTTKELSRPSVSQLATALLAPCGPENSGPGSLDLDLTVDTSWVLVPEEMQKLDKCCWNGDGHYDMSAHPGLQPPSLGQIITFLQLVDTAVLQFGQALCLSSPAKLAVCAVLAGAVMVLARGMSADAAWKELLRTCPDNIADPCRAWDRFPSPFAVKAQTGSSSLRVIDCLAGLEFARDSGWIGDYRSFSVPEWHMLRKRLDASWMIPGKMLAMANPWGSAQNPKFPGLLEHRSSDTHPGSATHLDQARLDETQNGESRLQAARGLHVPKIELSSSGYLDSRIGRAHSSSQVLSTPSSLPGVEVPPISPTETASDVAFSAKAKVYVKSTEDSTPLKAYSNQVASPVHHEGTEPNGCAGIERSSLLSLRDTDTFMTYLRRANVVSVVRLNKDSECPKQSQHEDTFRQIGLNIITCAFEDGGVPTNRCLKQLFAACEESDGSCIAVHCVAGLGRTACMVGAYAVSSFKMQGPAFHGWSRICRPGSVQSLKQEAWIRALRPKSERGTPSSSATLSPVKNPLSSAGRLMQDYAEGLRGSRMWI